MARNFHLQGMTDEQRAEAHAVTQAAPTRDDVTTEPAPASDPVDHALLAALASLRADEHERGVRAAGQASAFQGAAGAHRGAAKVLRATGLPAQAEIAARHELRAEALEWEGRYPRVPGRIV